ncbi:sulfotransferase [Fodinibius salsisoli]|uniref:Sulfotransferase n=1 Tax=Fodinibius salsisoli TaxID=2820877 RepID=A0ABT3PJC2_9BACT|nr:sulfotransferase [Fodinibius salsisoli]MCW9706039.1 sulfotransferase [Fodinibius salsisoli]
MIFCIIGYSRSGTTYLSNLIYNNIECKQFNEPHLLWKNIDKFNIYDQVKPVKNEYLKKFVARKLRHDNKIVIEKSPPNLFRPETVKYVLPEAKILFIERDEQACLQSNVKATLKHGGFNPAKYLQKSQPDAYNLEKGQNPQNTLLLHKQIHSSQVFNFTKYSLLKFNHWRKGLYPFGPKLSGYDKLMRERGPEYYHTKCIDLIKEYKKKYIKLFDDIHFIKLEKLVENSNNYLDDILGFIKRYSSEA